MARQWRVLIVTAVAVFMAFLDATIVNIAFPDIRASFPGASVAELSWVLNAYNIVFAALLVPAGRLADVVGRKRMFIGGGALFVGASVLCGLAPSAQALIGLRALQAVGGAALVPTSLGLLLPEFPLRLRATATALWGATGAVAAATGPSLGGVLVDAASWRWVFFVNLPVGLAALVPARRLLREHREPGSALPDGLGAALLALGVGAVSLGIVKGPDWHWDGRVAAAVVTGLVVLVAFAVRSARHPSPALELSLFRVRSFAVANVGVLVFSLGFYALLLGNVLFLTGVWHYSVLEAGFGLTPGPLMAALAAPFGGRLSDRFGQRVVAVPGGLLFAAGAALFALDIGATPNYVTEFLPATILTGTGVGLSFSAFSSAAVAELPPRRYATGSAVSACSRQIGAVLGISVLIAIVGTPAPDEALGAFRDAWALMALTGASAGLIALGLGRIRARDPEAAPAPPVAGHAGRLTFAAGPGEERYNSIGVVHGRVALTRTSIDREEHDRDRSRAAGDRR